MVFVLHRKKLLKLMKKPFLILSLVIITLVANAQNNPNLGVEMPFEIEPMEVSDDASSYKAMWDTLYTFPLYQFYNVSGIETNGRDFYSTTWDTNWFFRHHMNGAIYEAFQIEGVEKIRDMAYVPKNQYFYGSDDLGMLLYELDLENRNLIRTIPVQCEGVTGIRHLAYDPQLNNNEGGFWLGNWNELGAVDMNGNQLVAGSEIQGNIVNVFGSAYDCYSDPDHPILWLGCTLFPVADTIPVPTFRAFDINTKILTERLYEVKGGLPGWINDSVYMGGLCTAPVDGKHCLVANFQVLMNYNSNIAAVFELAPIGVNEYDNNINALKVEPNPVAEVCKIDINGFVATDLKLYNIVGDLVYQCKLDVNSDKFIEVNMAQLSSGLYTFVLSNSRCEKRRVKVIKE